GPHPQGGRGGTGARGDALSARTVRHGRGRARRPALRRPEATRRPGARPRLGAEDPHPRRSAERGGRAHRGGHPRGDRAPGEAVLAAAHHPPRCRRLPLRPDRRPGRGARGGARRSREPAAGRRHLRRLRGGAAAPRRTRGARRNDAGPGGGPMSATAPAHPHNRAQKELCAFHEEKAIAKAYDGRLLRRLWGYVRPHRAILYVSFAALAIQVVLQLVQPILMGEVVARAAEKDAAALMRTGATLAGLLVLLQLVTFGQMYTM